MAADLFESYAVTLVAALILGKAAFGSEGLVFPLVVPAIGVLTAVIGIFLTDPRPGDRNALATINRGFFASALISAVLVVLASFIFLPGRISELEGVSQPVIDAAGDRDPRLIAIVAVLIGLVLAAAIQLLTGYFTETEPASGARHRAHLAHRSRDGHPGRLLRRSRVGGLLGAADRRSGVRRGAARRRVDRGLAVRGRPRRHRPADDGRCHRVHGHLRPGHRQRPGHRRDVRRHRRGRGARVLTDLDAVGNSTKAITKGIAIATAVLAATALFGSFTDAVVGAVAKSGAGPSEGLTDYEALQYLGILNIADPTNLVGLIIGASVVFLFSGLAITAVSRAAGRVVFEVREQFRTKPGIMDYTERPDYSRVVDICTRDSLRELATPGLLAVLAPIAVGFGLGSGALGSYLAGAIGTGVLMAVLLSNSGGAWDNAKKLVEDGAYGGKGSDAHAATVIGDTVGDPFKDTAGPALNPLIKVMNLVSLLVAPAVVQLSIGADQNDALRIGLSALAAAIIVAAVVVSKRRSVVVGAEPATTSGV